MKEHTHSVSVGYFVGDTNSKDGWGSLQITAGVPCLVLDRKTGNAHKFALYLERDDTPRMQFLDGGKLRSISLIDMVNKLEQLGMPVETITDHKGIAGEKP